MGLEYAALLGGMAFIFIDFPHADYLWVILLILWGSMIVVRILAATKTARDTNPGVSKAVITSLRSIYPASAHFLFILQLVVMSVVYYAAFRGIGANLHWIEALALSSITVFISLIAFVPNGLGLTDSIWVLVAMKAGVTLEASVSLAILIRVGHLISALIIYLVLHFMWGKSH